MDTADWRLKKAAERLRRAGVHNAECRPLNPDKPRWVDRQNGRFDQVLIDAPCSGTGTWRRNPDQKWRITPESLQRLISTQHELLEKAAPFVKAGGLLIYVTCSLLSDENQNQIRQFADKHDEFTVLDLMERVQTLCPSLHPAIKANAWGLNLTPAQHGTDGFFIAILEKKKAAQTERELAGTEFEVAQTGLEVAGGPGFEPRLSESESDVLPLNYPPVGS